LKLQQSWKAHSGIVRDVLAFGHAVYSCGEDNQVVKTGDTGEDRKVLHYHTGFATSLALMSSKKLLSASYSGEVNILNI
jgi:hypothetical protein